MLRMAGAGNPSDGLFRGQLRRSALYIGVARGAGWAASPMTERLDPYQLFAAGEFRCLLDSVRSMRYSVVDCLDQYQRREPSTLSFRYDVHWRDVHVAHAFLRVHGERRIPATFFLHHGYSALEQRKAEDFVRLAAAIRSTQQLGVKVEVGFHDSPVDRHLLWQVAGGDEPGFVEWLSGDAAITFFSELAASVERRDQFHAEVLKTFVRAVEEARVALGPFQLSAGHGGKISQVLRPRLAELGPLSPCVSECFAENWLSPARLSAAGLAGDLELFKRDAPTIAAITEGGGRIEKMCADLARYASKRRPIVALIHPATWGRSGRRDIEWSQRLQLPPLRVFVAVNGAALLKDATAGSPPEGYDLVAYTEPTGTDLDAADGLERASLLDLLSDPGHGRRPAGATLGGSVVKYGALVGGMLRATWGGSSDDSPAGRRASALANFVEQEACRIDKGGATLSEWSYFLFSSSQRALALARALSHFLGRDGAGGVERFVDHGTGIGFMPLVINEVLPLQKIVGTEVKEQFVKVGRSMWNALGLEGRMTFEETSVTDYEYREPTDVVCFGHMLYRVAPEHREDAIRAATDSLRSGGLIVINELMNRPDLDGRYTYNCLTSDELLGYLDGQLELFSVDVGPSKLDVLHPRERAPAFFSRSNNLVIGRKN